MTAIESINTGFYPAGVSEKLDNINTVSYTHLTLPTTSRV